MTIGTIDSALICLHTSMPSIPGNIMSSKTKSGGVARKISITSSPRPTKSTSMPSPVKTIASISARSWSSSTTIIKVISCRAPTNSSRALGLELMNQLSRPCWQASSEQLPYRSQTVRHIRQALILCRL